jgi:hypothetical protein
MESSSGVPVRQNDVRLADSNRALAKVVGTGSQSLLQSGTFSLTSFRVGSRAVKEGRHAATGHENVGWTASGPCSDLCEDR